MSPSLAGDIRSTEVFLHDTLSSPSLGVAISRPDHPRDRREWLLNSSLE